VIKKSKTVLAGDKYRHELKYICSDLELRIVEQKLKTVMKPDPHADQNGEYLIRSVYFDDYQRSRFFENEDGVDPREKFRIRAYNCSDGRIALEKKIKSHGMTGKRSCLIDRDTCMKMLTGQPITDRLGRDPLLDEWIVQSETAGLRPVMLGEYVRRPYVYRAGNVRITFDRYICASFRTRDIFERRISRVAVLPTGYHVLEVKYDDFLPDVIYQMIDNGHMRQTTFSKFYLGCKALGGNIYEF
jgi:hypothetical protein